jgi:hypothetical protein
LQGNQDACSQASSRRFYRERSFAYFNREKAAGEAAFGGRRRWAA